MNGLPFRMRSLASIYNSKSTCLESSIIAHAYQNICMLRYGMNMHSMNLYSTFGTLQQVYLQCQPVQLHADAGIYT